MNQPEYRYVNVALEGVHNRKGIYDITRLGNPTGKKETYCTYFRYNNDMRKHFNQKGTVSGYQGSAWSDWLPIDIDSDNLEEAQSYLTYLVSRLDEYGIDSNSCRFYFSGAKGFHVMIPSEYFHAKPSEDIHKRFRKVAVEIAQGIDIDTAIYDKTRIFRLANTINAKTGLYKIELYPFEAMSLSIPEILERAKEPVEKLDIEKDFDASDELTELFHEDLNKPKKTDRKTNTNGVRVKICMQKMMEGNIPDGRRDEIGIRVATHLRQSGLSPNMIWSALDEWNNTNDPPKDVGELERIYQQGLEQYEYGCHDPFLKHYCDPNCLFYKKEWQRFG